MMNTKLLLFLSWMFLLAFLQTADEFWRFCLAYAIVLTICTYFYKSENRSRPAARKRKAR